MFAINNFSRFSLTLSALLLVSPWVFGLEATYYAESFEGSRTAIGDTYRAVNHTAAICGETLGTWAYVSSASTGMVVTLNDRPNCSRHPDVIDLSQSAFEVFAPLSRGRIQDIDAQVIGYRNVSVSKKTFDTEVFSDFSVELSRPLSNTYFTKESILLEWRVTQAKKDYIMVFLQHEETGEKVSFLRKVHESNGKFRFVLKLPEKAGKYIFVLAAGNSFETTTPETLILIDESTLQYPELHKNPTLIRPILEEWETSFLRLPDDTWGEIYFRQGKRVIRATGKEAIEFPDGLVAGNAQVSLDAFALSTASSLDRSEDLGRAWTGTVILEKKRDTTGKSKVNIRTRKGSFVFQFRVWLWEKVRKEYYLTLPSWEVVEYTFSKKWVDEDGYLIPWVLITGTVPATKQGTYRLETVLESGYAHFNVPLTQGNVWSILSGLSNKEKTTLESDKTKAEAYILESINNKRKNLGRSALTKDADLTAIALEKANNMALHDYVGHWTPEWRDILEFAKHLGLNHPTSMAENVAGGNVSHIVLQEWLEESGSHLYSMLNPTWKKVGIWYVVKNKKAYLVQVFGN